ncbi:MAG TPA: phospholipase D family protein [Candidatus Woesearchaeota archaeon]|nr:phospholipase D family protein [Candidatus Woesearchaeota archaeon]
MAKFLTTTGVSYHLENIIKNAKDRLILISPYLQINERIKEFLTTKSKEKTEVRLIFKETNEIEQLDWLKKLNHFRLSKCKNLHAKCYMNDDEVLITSMNLFEFSQQNNNEMGILISKNDDLSLFNEVLKEVTRILDVSDEVKVSIHKVNLKNETHEYKREFDSSSENGYCIRCGKKIKVDIMKPYCRDCYDVWSDFFNPDYEEVVCHVCGKSNKSTMNKPLCYDCYKENKQD